MSPLAIRARVEHFLRGAAPPARAPGRLRANPARAQRLYHGREYAPVPAYLTPGHMDLPEVREAARRALWTTDQRWRFRDAPWGEAEYVAEGNFGMGFRVEAPDGSVRLVKVPTAKSSQHRAWTREQQTAYMMHEAGVANELRAAGVDAAPEAIYVEFGGGTPAVVREWGEPVTSLSPGDYAALEADLVRVERELGWRVDDPLDLYRRADGSVYVADVGFWRAPDTAPQPWKWRDTDLDLLLGKAQVKYMGPALRALDGHRPRSRFASADELRPVTTLARLYGIAPLVEGEYQWLAENGAKASADATFSRDLLASLEHRALLGLPDPPPEILHAAGLAGHVDQRAPRRASRP